MLSICVHIFGFLKNILQLSLYFLWSLHKLDFDTYLNDICTSEILNTYIQNRFFLLFMAFTVGS